MSSPSDDAIAVAVKDKSGILKRLRSLFGQFKRDLREPLPGLEDKSLPVRIGGRFRYLLKKYGLKLVAAVILYYLVRDTLLYIVIPYLIARQFFG